MEFKLNDIFYANDNYAERSEFCIQNGYIIAEIEKDENGKRRFQIQEPPALTEKELAEIEIAQLKRKLTDTDYQAIKYAEGLISEEDYSTIKIQRQEWRDKINELETKLETIENK